MKGVVVAIGTVYIQDKTLKLRSNFTIAISKLNFLEFLFFL